MLFVMAAQVSPANQRAVFPSALNGPWTRVPSFLLIAPRIEIEGSVMAWGWD